MSIKKNAGKLFSLNDRSSVANDPKEMLILEADKSQLRGGSRNYGNKTYTGVIPFARVGKGFALRTRAYFARYGVNLSLKNAIERSQANSAASRSYRGVVVLWKPWFTFG